MNPIKTFTTNLLAVLIVTSIVMAAVSMTVSPTNLEFINDNEAKNFTVTNTAMDAANVTITGTTTVSDGVNSINFLLSDIAFELEPSGGVDARTITVTTSGDPQALEFGRYSTDLTVTANDGNGNETLQKVTLTAVSSFCSAGAVGGNLTIKDVDIDNRDGDDDEWELLDVIEIEVEIENNGDDEIEDVEIHLGFFDSNGRDMADDFDFDNSDEEKIELGDINDGDDEKDTFVFRVPADFEDGNYKLAIKAFSDDLGETVECVDFAGDLESNFFEVINVDRVNDEERFVVVDDITIDSQASCGDIVSGSFTVFNIGDEDQERVLITMQSTGLGIDQSFEITEDLDQGDDETLSYSFQVPANTENKLHVIEFRTEYDYKNGVYRERSEDKFVAFLNVLGCTEFPSGPSDGNLLITASLVSDARAGEELVVTSVITNTGSEQLVVVIDAKAYQAWADLVSVSPNIATLNTGESSTITFTFNVKDEASGTQSFIIETAFGGDIEIQEVEVNIQGEDSDGITGFAGFNLGESGGLLWVIAIINVILIILIIVVAVRLSRR